MIISFMVCFIKADNYTYLLDKYQKETELEAKIVVKIAKDILVNKPVILYIPGMKSLDYKVYSSFVKVTKLCSEANFVFVKYSKSHKCQKKGKNSYILTNNYKKLLSDKTFLGAFFWSKSRPNIVLVKSRLSQKNIYLPREYERYIEDL
ncbi:hypothetical protein CP965_13050 [Halarcobacter mediterraneus]|uniref:Uncharacterized protein n=1 Tax=Halarcobacter mediterraneus TaxID=2023153 RepID=A0A4Q1AQF9_9BACT|nr:hypothetical protein CP965_13050 [Halarcobacter mediterraneus]